MRRSDLQEQLGAIDRPDAFVDAMMAVAAQLHVDLSEDDVRARMSSPSLIVEPPAPADDGASAWPPIGWMPTAVELTAPSPRVDWMWFGSAPLTEPFYEDEIRIRGARPFARISKVRTSPGTLIAGLPQAPSLAPHGFVFHMSRCGSTLVAQALAAVPEHIVVSEAPPIDAVVRWAATSGATPDEQVAALRAVIAALGRDRDGASHRYFVKLDAWHAFALPLFRTAFPDVPWLFLYRDPAEVMVSLRRQPGIHAVPGMLPEALIGFDPTEVISLEDYAARLFAGMFQRVSTAVDSGAGMAVDYSELRTALEQRIPRHFGFTPNSEDAAHIATAIGRNAKMPDTAFASDTVEKRVAITPAIADSVARWLAAPYAALHGKAAAKS